MDNSNEVILNILGSRRYVVPEMSFLAAQRRTEDELKAIKDVITSDDLPMLEKDIKVHQMIARASHHLFGIIGLNFFNQIFREYGYLYFNDKRNIERSRKFHNEIYDHGHDHNASQIQSLTKIYFCLMANPQSWDYPPLNY